jgi:hypothetical protein
VVGREHAEAGEQADERAGVGELRRVVDADAGGVERRELLAGGGDDDDGVVAHAGDDVDDVGEQRLAAPRQPGLVAAHARRPAAREDHGAEGGGSGRHGSEDRSGRAGTQGCAGNAYRVVAVRGGVSARGTPGRVQHGSCRGRP